MKQIKLGDVPYSELRMIEVSFKQSLYIFEVLINFVGRD